MNDPSLQPRNLPITNVVDYLGSLNLGDDEKKRAAAAKLLETLASDELARDFGMTGAMLLSVLSDMGCLEIIIKNVLNILCMPIRGQGFYNMGIRNELIVRQLQREVSGYLKPRREAVFIESNEGRTSGKLFSIEQVLLDENFLNTLRGHNTMIVLEDERDTINLIANQAREFAVPTVFLVPEDIFNSLLAIVYKIPDNCYFVKIDKFSYIEEIANFLGELPSSNTGISLDYSLRNFGLAGVDEGTRILLDVLRTMDRMGHSKKIKTLFVYANTNNGQLDTTTSVLLGRLPTTQKPGAFYEMGAAQKNLAYFDSIFSDIGSKPATEQ